MSILEYAMQMELDGKAFYETAAARVDQQELKKIFLILADEEDKHYRFFRKLSAMGAEKAAKELEGQQPAIKTTKNLFQRLTEQKVVFGDDVRSTWKEALEIEIKAERMYREAAEREPDTVRRRLLDAIADEEKSHVYLIDNMLSFMADPETFADSSTFRSFMSWEGR